MLSSLKEVKKSSLLLIAFFVPLIIISFGVYLLHYRYLFFILPILFIFAAYLIVKLSTYLKKIETLAIVGVSIIVLLNGFNFLPKSNYDLEPLTPQPNFKEVYTYINEHYDNEVIIDAYPVLSKIYLNKVDYAMKFSLTGRQDKLNLTRDYYLDLPFINVKTLKEIKECYLIVDELALERIDKELKDYINNMTIVIDLNEVKAYKC